MVPHRVREAAPEWDAVNDDIARGANRAAGARARPPRRR